MPNNLEELDLLLVMGRRPAWDAETACTFRGCGIWSPHWRPLSANR